MPSNGSSMTLPSSEHYGDSRDMEVEGELEVAGLSPPSESRLLQRRKSLHNSQSLQLNRIGNPGSKVLSIKVSPSSRLFVLCYIISTLIAPTYLFSLLSLFLTDPV